MPVVMMCTWCNERILILADICWFMNDSKTEQQNIGIYLFWNIWSKWTTQRFFRQKSIAFRCVLGRFWIKITDKNFGDSRVVLKGSRTVKTHWGRPKIYSSFVNGLEMRKQTPSWKRVRNNFRHQNLWLV